VGCLDENTVAAFVASRLPSDELGRARAHASACAACHEAVSVALTASGVDATSATQQLGPAPADVAAWRPSLDGGTVVGRYTILGLVGRGGMGEVYAAYDPRLDRRVALKLISGERAASDAMQERLLREAQAIAKVSHPNVVVVHDAGPFGAQVFVAMEFVEGQTLAAWLAERERPWREILDAFLQAARGLAAAHAAGLVHRDFKPQNVMMTAGGTARVMDFGLARRVGESHRPSNAIDTLPYGAPDSPALTRTGDLLGTPLYMAPEQFVDGRIDARADQFSLCVALYWALFGVHPFGGTSLAELAKNAAGGGPASPKKKAGTKGAPPPWVEKAITRGLATDPAARWPAIDDLVDALSRDPGRRWRTRAAVAGGVALCLVAGLSIASLARRQRALCAGGPARLAGVWELEGQGTPARREAVRTAILRSGTAEPQKTWERVSALLDRHVTSWLAAYRDTCEATAVRGEQSEAMLDLRMACLADNLDGARALTTLLAAGARSVADHAVEAAGSLEDLGRCGDVQQLRSGVRPPRDPMIRERVKKLESKLREGQVLAQAGEKRPAAAVARAVLGEPAAAAYVPLRAEALYLEGLSNDHEAGRGLAPLENALFTAESCGDDRVVALAATQLVYSVGSEDPPAAERWAALAAAALTRMGGDARIESWLANNLGAFRWGQGRLADAKTELERAVRLKKQLLGPDHLDVAVSLATLAAALIDLGLYDEARAALAEALPLARRWTTESSELLGAVYDNQGDLMLATGHLDEAREAYRHSADILAVAVEGPDRDVPVVGLAKVALASGGPAEAVALLDAPARFLETNPGLPKDVAETRFTLARALDASHRDPARARSLAKAALATYASQPGFEKRRAEVQRWLDERE